MKESLKNLEANMGERERQNSPGGLDTKRRDSFEATYMYREAQIIWHEDHKGDDIWKREKEEKLVFSWWR